MPARPIIVVFDIGKTNKKLLAFDTRYQVVLEQSVRLAETYDNDGDPCEDLAGLQQWMADAFNELNSAKDYRISALNVAAYGASLVYINESGSPVAPLYNYLKPFPLQLQQQFYRRYGGEAEFAAKTASPVLGSLNAGMQLYRLKHQWPDVFSRTRYALHFPQYLAYLFSGRICSDLTSIGCHTNLWDFTRKDYHEWVQREGLLEKLAPVVPGDSVTERQLGGSLVKVGTGLHDSSAALIPYLVQFSEPFVLLSSGTWCISLNPFNKELLTPEALQQDCLCYLTYQGNQVKASRLFAGQDHEQQASRIAAFFQVDPLFYREMKFNPAMRLVRDLAGSLPLQGDAGTVMRQSDFALRDLSSFASPEAAYHQLVFDLVRLQWASTQLVLQNSPVGNLFVDGGFSKNDVYMNLLAAAFPGMGVYGASLSNASALGAALVLHRYWNEQPVPAALVQLKRYYGSPEVVCS